MAAAPRRRSKPEAARAPARPGATQLRHELEVHQEELRAQNEKLIAVLQTLEEARDRYLELYDFAPNGYVTLDARGYVREANLSAAALFGRDRERLVGLPILRFIGRSHRTSFLRFLNLCRTHQDGAWPILELPIETPAGARTVHLTCRPRADGRSGARELFTAVVDVTEQRRLEGEREHARRQHVALVRQVLSLQERERQRIARDIHDDLGQQVTGLRLKLEWLAETARHDATLQERIGAVQEVATRVDRQIDFLLRELRPVGLDDLGLLAALEQSVHQWGETFGIPAEFTATGGVQGRWLPPDTEAHVYRIVQEALNNIHKHASAQRVTVALEHHGGSTRLTIRDDGVGIAARAPADTSTRRGLGLLGMRERAALVGGRLDFESRPGLGTTVILELP